ncbi:RagB/SusD family nutrient uptake outer membrane protein [Niabella beijingensis]|uniref:RagB/SusD family nutrient uptake outer membrane protein n=1 Tax=Niabella beijingensis TaxID=2872700 RepID=UPI001CBADDFC|nr:RagB/SusD family nutrient uptake outer membrane protein [Niabella beijingensis]MBZ4192481.1 RagB/SusD family nutrient uptake outer membrane protein [Niabella beijingensis]
MKKIILYIGFIALWTSCKKQLTEVPESFISKANYYKNASDAQTAITGAYSALADNYGINYWLFLVNHSDYEEGRGSQAPISVFSQILDVANIGRAGDIWSTFYSTINRANSVLENVPAIEMDETLKNKILAEAHFLRGMSYFNLVRGFGPVPLKTKESVDASQVDVPRSSEDEVYALIIEDAKAAVDGLPESVGAETGRASKGAAKMLLANVYLTREKWAEAAKEADDIIKSGIYTLVNVQKSDDFYKIFAVTTSTEDVLSIHHSDSRQSTLPNYLHRPNTPPYNYSSGGVYAWLPNMKSFLAAWDDKDLRKNFNLYKKYLGPNGDSVLLPSATPVLFKKFITGNDGLATYSDPVYRYAEAFLVFAEADCMANGGPTAQALERLNWIRRRAYGYSPATPSAADFAPGMNQEQFRDTVLKERALEFIAEGQRWHDLKRTGTVKKAMGLVGRTVIDARLLWPIPQEEIDNNGALSQADQNPGY